MRTYYTVLFFQCMFIASSIGQNLVPNPSFESRQLEYCSILGPGEFNTASYLWISPSAGTPDLYLTTLDPTCYNFQPNSQYSGPIGIKGNEKPHTGEAMAAISSFTIEGFQQREYIQVQLDSSLSPGETYQFSMYVSAADSIERFMGGLGVYFSEQAISSNNDRVLDYSPQIQSTEVHSIYQGWQLVQGELVADAPYKFITIGNFQSDEDTYLEWNSNYSGRPGNYGAYCYIDDVSLIHMQDTTLSSRIQTVQNPVQDWLAFNGETANESVDIRVIDAFGKTIIEMREPIHPNTKINCTSWQPGIYYIHLTLNGEFAIKKILKL